MMKHKVLYPRDDINTLYVSRKEVTRELANAEDCVDATIEELKEYKKRASKD